jgi:hypothetical protein
MTAAIVPVNQLEISFFTQLLFHYQSAFHNNFFFYLQEPDPSQYNKICKSFQMRLNRNLHIFLRNTYSPFSFWFFVRKQITWNFFKKKVTEPHLGRKLLME